MLYTFLRVDDLFDSQIFVYLKLFISKVTIFSDNDLQCVGEHEVTCSFPVPSTQYNSSGNYC